MKGFEYVLRSEHGLHARPCALLSKKAEEFSSSVTVMLNEKKADGKRLISLMKLCAKKGDTLVFAVEGEDEETASRELRRLAEEEL